MLNHPHLTGRLLQPNGVANVARFLMSVQAGVAACSIMAVEVKLIAGEF